MDPPTMRQDLPVKVFLDHQVNHHDSTFHDQKPTGGQQQSFKPEVADWIQTLGRPGETLLLALKRCIETTGTCPVAFVKGKVVEQFDEPLDKLLMFRENSCEKEIVDNEKRFEKKQDVASFCDTSQSNVKNSLDLCFAKQCKTCELLVQDQMKPVLMSVTCWSVNSEAIKLGHLPAALEVGDVKCMVGNLIGRPVEDVSIMHDDQNLKDLTIISDLTSGNVILFEIWKENNGAAPITQLQDQWKDVARQQTDLEKCQTLKIKNMQKKKKELVKSQELSLQRLEEDREKELANINRRYNQAMCMHRKEGKMMEALLDKEIADLEEQCEKVKALKRERTLISSHKKSLPRLYAYLSITADNSQLGTIVVELRNDVVPKTVQNFLALCTGEKGFGYKGSIFHDVKPGILCGMRANTGGKSIYGGSFDKENFELKHTGPGILSMYGMSGDETKSHSSSFYITTDKKAQNDGYNVAFGCVVDGLDIVKRIESYGSDDGTCSKKIVIADCGQI